MNTQETNKNKSGVPEGIEKQRLSKIYLLVGFLKGIKSGIIPLLIIFAGSLFGGEGVNEVMFRLTPSLAITRLHIFMIILIIALILGFISITIQYFCTFWYLTDTEVVLCKGLLNKKITRMPLEKIHSINTSETLVERICNVVSVKIDSAGGATSGDIIIPAIKNETAEYLRAEIRRLIQLHASDINSSNQELSEGTFANNQNYGSQGIGDTTSVNPQGEQGFSAGNNPEVAASNISGNSSKKGYAVEDARQYNLTIKEIFLAGLANGRTMLYLFIGVGAAWQLIDGTGLSDYVYEHGDDIARVFVSYGVAAIVVSVLAVLLVSWAVSVISFAIKFYGFTIRTEGDRIETHRGLISRINTQISINRIQEIHVSQDVLAKVFGYATIKAEIATSIVAKDGNDQNGMGTTGVILHPFIKKKEVDGYIAAFIPEYVDRPRETEALPKAACRRSFFRYGRWTLLFWILPILAFLIFAPSNAFPLMPLLKNIAIVVGIIVTLFLMFTAWRSYKGKGIAIGDKIIAIKYGAYKTKYVYIPKRKIQMALSRQNPFQRASKVAHITIFTAASGAKAHILDISEVHAAEYLNWATPNSTIRKTMLAKEYAND